MTDEEFRTQMMSAQYYIPRRMFYLSIKFPTLTWKRVNELYQQIVTDLLEEYNVECILDIGSLGQGMLMAEREFERRLIEESMKNNE